MGSTGGVVNVVKMALCRAQSRTGNFSVGPTRFAKISKVHGPDKSESPRLAHDFSELILHSKMPGFAKRKRNEDAPAAVAASSSKKVRPSNAPAKKAAAKPAPPPEPESSDDDEEEQEEDGSDSAGYQSAASHPASEGEADAPTAGADEAKKTFADLGVREELCDACENLKFKNPTPIQAQAIPLALEGRDVIGLAETGSGKTAAFVLPILQALLEKQQPLFGLILAPTRELAYQISQQVDALGSIINVKCATLVGGMDMVPQAIALSKRPHIIVATPGRCSIHTL